MYEATYPLRNRDLSTSAEGDQGAKITPACAPQAAEAIPRVTDRGVYINRRKLELVPIFKQGMDYLKKAGIDDRMVAFTPQPQRQRRASPKGLSRGRVCRGRGEPNRDIEERNGLLLIAAGSCCVYLGEVWHACAPPHAPRAHARPHAPRTRASYDPPGESARSGQGPSSSARWSSTRTSSPPLRPDARPASQSRLEPRGTWGPGARGSGARGAVPEGSALY